MRKNSKQLTRVSSLATKYLALVFLAVLLVFKGGANAAHSQWAKISINNDI